MKSIIEKIIAALMIVCMASSVWATASLEESGATVPTTATLAFKGATLSQVTADTLSGIIGGSWACAIAGYAMTFNNFDRSSEGSGTITCQAQVQHGANVKGVLLTFTQDGANVKVQKTGAKYVAGTVGDSIASGTTGYYDVSNLKLTLTKPTPIAVFDGTSGGFKKTSINGVTFDKNGNTVPDDGSYVKISASKGALFKLDAGYEFVVGEFTVTNLNESAAANRVLALWSPTADASSTTTPGVALESGTVTTRGVWNNAIWSNTDFNGTLATGISTDTARTFVLTTEDSKVNNVQNDTGTHLFELTGANPGTAVYGGTTTLGLRGDQTYRTLIIGGPEAGSLSAMTDLVITKVVIYASNSTRQFTSTATTTIANVENPAAFYVGNGGTINASTINAGVTASSAAYVYTEAGATLNLDAELNGHTITFVGSISGVPGSADGLTLGSVNDKVTLTNASYVPVIKGRGTVVYPDNTIPSSDSTAWLTSSNWAGTLSLSNIQGSSSGQPGWYAPFHNYGSANSTIKVSGFTGFFTGGNYESAATLEIAAGSTFTLNNGNNGNSMTFAKLTGSGDIVICGDNGPAIQYVMRDASEFAGNITVSQSGSNTFKKSIVLGGGSSYNYNTSNYQKQICVLGDVTVAAGKTWTADSGIVVNGTLTKADSTTTLSGTITGTGKIIYNNELPNSANFTVNTWTGTVEVNGGSTTSAGIEAANATQFMNAGSTFSVASGTVTLGTANGLTGAVNVNSGATLQIVDSTATSLSLAGTNNGTINLQLANALTSLTLSDGIARGTVNYPSSLTTLNLTLKENLADDTELVFSVGNGTTLTAATVTMYGPDGSTVNNTAAAAVSEDGHSVTVTYTPTVSGNACWIAYEMDYVAGSKSGFENTGSDTTGLNSDGITGDNAFYNGMLYTCAHPYRGSGSLTYPADGNWSAVVRCSVPRAEDAAVIVFGGYDTGLIGLVAGEHPESEMRLVQTTNESGSYNSHYITNATMTVVNAATLQHVYVFSVENNQTVKVYCDGQMVCDKTFNSPFSIGGGFQIGSVLGGAQNTGIKMFSADRDPAKSLSESERKDARIDCVRLYKTVLGPNAIKQLSVEFPAVKLYKATVADGANTTWNDLTWSPEWDGGNAYSKIVLTAAGDGSLTFPSTITAQDFEINVPAGKVLTISKATPGVDNPHGTTFTLTNPLEVNGGSVAFSETTSGDEMNLDFIVGGTGSVLVDTDKTINVVDGGALTRITGSGTVVYSALQASALSFDDWTGTVQIPAITTGEINLNNYGIDGSTVKVMGISGSAWLTNELLAPTIELGGDVTLSGFSTSFPNTINKLIGSYAFSLTYNDSLTDDAYKGYFLIKDVSEFTGSFAVASPGLVLGGTDRPNTADWYGKIVVQGAMKPPTTANAVVATSAAVLDYTDTNGSTSPITGDLYVVDGAQFKFPASAVFPYKVAGSCSGVTSLAASNYMIGEEAGTQALTLGADGKAYLPTTAAFAGGENEINWTSLPWDVTNYRGQASIGAAACTITVSDSGTLNLGTASAGTVTINVPSGKTLALSGTLTADEIFVTGSGTVNCLAANTLQGTIKGASTVTISYPDHTLPSGATWTDTAWEGTLVLNKCGHLASTPAGDRVRVPFENYGNANSKIRAPGFKGFAAVAGAATAENSYCAATLVIDSTDVFEFNHGWKNVDVTDIYPENSNAGYKFAKLTGTGKLILDGTTDFAQYVFSNVSEFAGTVEITYPGVGGRKSYLFGASNVLGSSFPANLLIAENTSATVAAGKTWDIPAGIIIDKGATLSMGNGSTITVLSSRSESTATLKVLDDASATVTNVMGSVIKTRLDIGSNAMLNITDTSLTKLTIPADSTTVGEPAVARTYSNAGMLNLSGCTGLKELYLVLGETNSKDFELSKVTLPTSGFETIYFGIGEKRDITGYTLPTAPTGVKVCYYATETVDEYAGKQPFSVTGVPDRAEVWLLRRNGVLLLATDNGDGSRSYSGGTTFAGAACWHEWDFEQNTAADPTLNKLHDTGACTTNDSDVVGATLQTVGTGFSYGSVKIPPSNKEDKVTIPSSVYPYVTTDTNSVALAFGTAWSAAVRCTMPSEEGKRIAFVFGDKDSGMLGLATSDRAGFVELFNWTTGDKYQALAQLMVENATTKMHIYVLAVEQVESKNYVSLYRDGEFIHKAEFKLNSEGAITKFKVGDIFGDHSEGDGLPAAVTAGEVAGGYVDYVRLYNKTIDSSMAEGLSARRPYVSSTDLFERTMGVDDDWVEADTWKWTKKDTAEVANADDPDIAGANVTVASTGPTTLSLNRTSDIKYGTLIFTGSDTIILDKTNVGKIGANMLVVRSGAKLKVDCTAVDFSDSTVGVDENATLTFDLANFPFETIATDSTFTLIGNVPEAGNESARARYGIALPAELPANIKAGSVTASFVGSSYKLTVETTHQAGAVPVYYRSGDITGTMDVYLDAELEDDPVRVLPGDHVNITSAAATGDVVVYASFNGNLVVSRTTLNITPAGEGAVLDGSTITAAEGCTVHFAAGTYGAMTLVGPGAFVFDGDATVAGLSGAVGITVADGKVLTLGSKAFVTGGVSGACTVVLPVITDATVIDLNDYGNEDSTVVLSGGTSIALPLATVAPALRLDGAVTISASEEATPASESEEAPVAEPGEPGEEAGEESEEEPEVPVEKEMVLTRVAGNGNLTFAGTPYAFASVTIAELAGYTGTIANNTTAMGTIITVSKLYLGEDVAFGDPMLAKAGDVIVEAVYVDEELSNMVLAYETNGIYRAVAQYSGTGYRTLAGAIAAAGANLVDIVVLDPTAELPGDYEIVGEMIVKKATSYTWVGGASGTWATIANWQFGDGEAASRVPGGGDAVTIGSAAAVTIDSNTVIESIVLANEGASIIVGAGATLDAAVTTTVANHYVKLDGDTYRVALCYKPDPTPEGNRESAVVTVTIEGDVPEVAAEITLPADYAGTVVIPPNVTSLSTTGTSLATGKVVVKQGATDITGAFTVGGSAGAINIGLNENGSVKINDETITVKPEVKASADAPMALDGETGKTSFTIKTIPGLYYSVWSATSIDDVDTAAASKGTPVQADGTAETVGDGAAMSNDETVRYYIIKVGISAEEAQN